MNGHPLFTREIQMIRRCPTLSLHAFSMLALLIATGLIAPRDVEAQEDNAAWAALASGGHVALMRHALAPGTGDPAGFSRDDCATQRNLSTQGRAQARAIGERFRERGIAVNEVRASRWCRCLDTAELLGLGEVIPTPALDSFFRDRGAADRQTRELGELIEAWSGEGALVLVTHQVNITALTGVYPRSGEILVLAPEDGALELVGRLGN
ncbi:Histidine phosphatase superfamily (branch 1) [Onishia taeanensis]|uniref:Histidine phosphatase superfamily (Branch 1) n=2 Tax=Onishia taeanensis TaxID=284577 RepID=A0A1G7UE38_9GAMM|nr:Histidine phosphatase superfamily (branch 1) [Halomonas taeanensis]